MKNIIEKRYNNAILTSPTRGTGLHQHLARITNYAVMLGISVDQVNDDIMESIPFIHGSLNKGELLSAYDFSISNVEPIDFDNQKPYDPYDKIKNIKLETADIFLNTKKISIDSTLKDIRNASPIKIDSKHQGNQMLEALYKPDEYVFIGNNNSYDDNVRQVKQWQKDNLLFYPYIICNPFTGEIKKTKSGNDSKRCDECISIGRYILLEFDEISIKDQINIVYGLIEKNFPVYYVVYSGSKSIHTWLRVNCPVEEWTEKVRENLFESLLSKLKIDVSCKNLSRLSRMAGHKRISTQKCQELLYLKAI